MPELPDLRYEPRTRHVVVEEDDFVFFLVALEKFERFDRVDGRVDLVPAGLKQVLEQLQEIGEAMASSKALQGAGQALAEGKYDKAMKELGELEDLEFERNEARTTVEKLKKAARRSGNGAQGRRLSQYTCGIRSAWWRQCSAVRRGPVRA